MSNTDENFFSPEEIAEIEASMREFAACHHVWVKEPIDSVFEYICYNCGGAQGIRPSDEHDTP